ncbi:hypothetical protein CLV51_101206 [Chitinophaga niastensis]|uniref:Uncharacterized protein n=2 Tax=Chitinophaga niastensis TaxID=536980 RepID=A0A2P8HRQ0_CHINA|nr:hypothetical protein CLV51_101206 [Chitinophaga niastensis]
MYMSPAIAIPNFLTAIFMGWLYYHLRSVSGGILTRMLFNLTALVIFQYSNGDQFLSIAPLCHNSLDYKLIVAAMTLIFAAGIIYLQYYFTRHTALSNKTIN